MVYGDTCSYNFWYILKVWVEQLKFLGGSDKHKVFFQWEHEVKSFITRTRTFLFHEREGTLLTIFPYIRMQAMFRDLDGSLTGLEAGAWVLPDSGLHPHQHCIQSVPEFSVNPNFGGSACSSEVYFLRMSWNNAEPEVSEGEGED